MQVLSEKRQNYSTYKHICNETRRYKISLRYMTKQNGIQIAPRNNNNKTTSSFPFRADSLSARHEIRTNPPGKISLTLRYWKYVSEQTERKYYSVFSKQTGASAIFTQGKATPGEK